MTSCTKATQNMEETEQNNGTENGESQPPSEETSEDLIRGTEELMEWQEKGWKTPEKEEAPEAKAEREGREYWGEELEVHYENAAPEIKADVKDAQTEAGEIEEEISAAVERGDADELSRQEILKIAGVTEDETRDEDMEGFSKQLSEPDGLSDQGLADLHDRIYPEAPVTDLTDEEALNDKYEEQSPEPVYERSAQEIGLERLDKWTSGAKRFFRKGAAILSPFVLTKNGYRAVKESAVSGSENVRLLMNEKLESFATAGKIWRFRNEMESLTREQGPAIETMQQGYDLIEKIRGMSPEAQERKEFQALQREAERMVNEGRNEVNRLQGKLERAKSEWMQFLNQDTMMSVAIRGIKARKAKRSA